MLIRVDRKVTFEALDTLLARWKAKAFPYKHTDAVIPQTVIPAELRADRWQLACFYFYACIYMRGGIESLQAFRALLRMYGEHPELFDPLLARWMNPDEVAEILRRFIGWDAAQAARHWVENSRRLAEDWGADPRNLLKGLRSWTEAQRRIRNKMTKRDLAAAGPRGRGFMGFQPKMVSMLLYFFDWEGWLTPRFFYPPPADFHNFRIALNQAALVVIGTDLFSGAQLWGALRTSEALSQKWRSLTMAYLRLRKADPVELADALWLFSLVMCGNSPVNRADETTDPGMFGAFQLPNKFGVETFRTSKMRLRLERTCLRCPLARGCVLAIPSRPYYRNGLLVLRPRPKMEEVYGWTDPDLPVRVERPLENQYLFEPG